MRKITLLLFAVFALTADAATKTRYRMIEGAPINVIDYGAKGDGVTQTDSHVNAALTAAGNVPDGAPAATGTGALVTLTSGVYVIGATLAVPQGVTVRGAGKRATVLVRQSGFTGDLITLASEAALEDLRVDGNSLAGYLIHVTGDRGHLTNVETTGSTGKALVFDGTKGSGFVATGCDFDTAQAVGTAASVGVLSPGDGTSATPRRFLGCTGGGKTMIDIGGMNNFFVQGCRSEGMLATVVGSQTGPGSVIGSRIGSGSGGVVTFNGLTSVEFTANSFSDSPVLNDSTSVSWTANDSPSGTPTETGTSSGNRIFTDGTYTPTWTSTGTAPAIGNGTVSGYWSRAGRQVTVWIKFVAGTTTTFGTGRWEFSLPPSPGNIQSAMSWSGTIMAQVGANRYQLMAANTGTSTNVTGWVSGGATFWDASTPGAWASGDAFLLTFTYEAP